MPITEGGTLIEFDVWLRRSLAETYDRVLREPIPEELLLLIRSHRDRG
ncbi:MAG TPA: hypothetical protein VMI52_09715 [Acetobacteraceae bacterium]|nr:hypothetical protein [Acetobacteraceae bacterium]